MLTNIVETDKIILGGPGVVVEVDEAKFSKNMHHKGRLLKNHWILGGVEREDKSRTFFVPVPDRTKETLLSVISEYVAPGTIIHTGGWAGYNGLD